jgi:hypothetical protein
VLTSSGSLVADMNASASDLWHLSAFDAFMSSSFDVALLSLELQRADPTRSLGVGCVLGRLLADQFQLLAFGACVATFSPTRMFDTPS